MSVALLRKTARDYRWTTIVIAAVVVGFPVLIIHAFASVPWEMTQNWLKLPWIARLIRAIAGADLSEVMTINTLGGFAFVHPFMLAVTWGFLVAGTSGTLCGEIDRGTADVLLALPLSRFRVYATNSAWIFLMAPLMSIGAWIGVTIGDRTAGIDAPMDVWGFRFIVVNAVACQWAVAGIGLFCSSLGSRRGRVVGAVAAILLSSFLLNSLAAFWPKAEAVSVIGILHYFRPFAIIRDGGYQTTDIIVLLLVAAATWSAGAFAFTRRDIHAA